MTENAQDAKQTHFQLSAKQMFLALYVFVSISLSIACYFGDDGYFRIVGPIAIGLASSYLHGKCFQNSRPLWRFFKILGLSILVYLAAIVTGGVVASILRGPGAFHI